MPGLTDTPPEIAAMVRERLMARSNAERFKMSCRIFEAAREMILASLPGNISEGERRQLLFERVYGVPLIAREGEAKRSQKSKEYRRAGAAGVDQPKAGPKGEDAGMHPSQFAEEGAEVYAMA